MTGEVPGYVLREVLGQGTAATVWRAEVEGHPGRVVAIKRLRGPVRGADLDDLRREAGALERLSHPSILRLLDVVEDGDDVALVVPFAPGGSLASRLAAGDPGLTPVVVADLGARLGAALAAAHNAGLVHRDVKPANVLFDAEGQPLLADFGTARLLGDDRAATAGTAEYLDPEVLSGPPGVASDIYGLGATLYEALTGIPPYAGSTPEATLRAADRGRHMPLDQLVVVPSALAEAVERAIARDPRARPGTAAHLAGRLDEARRELEASDGPAAVSAPGSPQLPPPPPPREDATRPHAEADALGPAGTWSAGSPAAPERSGTRLFGPAPPRLAPDSQVRRRRVDRRLLVVDRRLLVAAAVLALVIPVGVVWWLTGDAAPVGDNEAPSIAGDAAPPVERTPPPRCDDVPPPPDTEDAELVYADVDARGCSVPVAWDGDRLLVPRAETVPEVYDLDARQEDDLVMGDWTCDGHDTPALYRPSTGDLFVFDGFAEEDEEITGRVEDTGVRHGAPRVLTDEAGCDRVEVEPG
jgi:eukaryotic-like serine/threonine-protein kinase